jgi:hypothetical protein
MSGLISPDQRQFGVFFLKVVFVAVYAITGQILISNNFYIGKGCTQTISTSEKVALDVYLNFGASWPDCLCMRSSS